MNVVSLIYNFSLIFIHVSHPLYICKQNLQAAMDKEDCGSIAVMFFYPQSTIQPKCGFGYKCKHAAG